jgi:amino acid transporter
MGLPALLLFGLAYLAPLIVLGIFGVVAQATAGATPSAYAVALVAMLFTASSYGRMAAVYPVAGSAYAYVRQAIDSRVGFLVGWAVMLDYLFLPMVIWLIGAAYLSDRFPTVPGWIWILSFIGVTTALNIVGIRIAKTANFILMAFQFLVITAFVGLSIASVVAKAGVPGLFSLTPFVNVHTSIGGISAGAAIAAYSFLGFDAVTTLTEEVTEPRKTVPRAIMLTALIGGAIFIIVAYATQLVHPGASFKDPSSAAAEIALTIGGNLFGAVFLAGLVLAQFASGIAAQAAGSRLIFAMARDGVLPRRLFGGLSRRFSTPVASIAFTGLVGLLALFMNVATSTSFINFGAFTAFTAVNISVIALYLKDRRTGAQGGVLRDLVVPAFGAAIDLWLLCKLDGNAIRLGLIWLCVGIVVLLFLTRGLRDPAPSVALDEDLA